MSAMPPPRDVIAASVREHFRVRLGPNTLANIRAAADPDPIPLSGGEADTVALLALQALKDAGYTIYRPVNESDDVW
jgi:hypothetical protein